MSAAIARMHPLASKVKNFSMRILLTWIAAHVGYNLGRLLFFCAFNSLDSLLSSFASEGSRWLALWLNPRAVEFALESTLMIGGSPWLYLLAAVSVTAWCFLLFKRKWNWFYVSVAIGFAALQFIIGLAWKV